MKIVVTGVAGFIGMFVAKRLAQLGHEVIGIDNMEPSYSRQLKYDRLQQVSPYANFSFYPIDLTNQAALLEIFETHQVDKVIHLAARTGVRKSLKEPHAYIQSNVVGFLNILESCRIYDIKHLVYASSSSVYGNNKKMPFSVEDRVDHPLSIYAVTKRSNELMAYSYSHLYQLPTTSLRFFTVYGPWGRPNMAPFLFTKAILQNEPIKVFNYGDMLRDFTYIDDIVESIIRVLSQIPLPHDIPYSIYNIGNSSPIRLLDFIATLEECLGKKAIKHFLPLQDGDVYATYANVDSLTGAIGFRPSTPLKEGVDAFVKWYKGYYGDTISL